MFSSRLPPSLEHNRISQALDAARAAGRELYDLTESNPTVVGLRYPERAILDALADPRALGYQPEPRGLDEARVAVAALFARKGVAVGPEHVFMTASTSEAYALLFKLLCDPGDQVLVPRPSYPLFDQLAALESVGCESYALTYDRGWFLDVEQVRRAIGPRTRAVLVVNPNNPTGSFLSRATAAELGALCAERGLALISDEVFAEYGYADDPERALTLAGSSNALTFCLGGLSKLLGLPQLKLGWLVAGGPPASLSEAELRLEHIADTYLSVGAPVMHAAARLLTLAGDLSGQLLARVRDNRARVKDALAGSAIDLLAAEGGWSAILRVPSVRSEEEWVLALLDAGVITHPGFFFDLPGPAHLVVSLIVAPEVLAEGLSRLLVLAARG